MGDPVKAAQFSTVCDAIREDSLLENVAASGKVRRSGKQHAAVTVLCSVVSRAIRVSGEPTVWDEITFAMR